MAPRDETEKVEACPWCGGSTTLGSNIGSVDYTSHIRYSAQCDDWDGCGWIGPDRKTEAEAIAAWNKVARAAASGEKWRELAREAWNFVEEYRALSDAACEHDDRDDAEAWLARYSELEKEEAAPSDPHGGAE